MRAGGRAGGRGGAAAKSLTSPPPRDVLPVSIFRWFVLTRESFPLLPGVVGERKREKQEHPATARGSGPLDGSCNPQKCDSDLVAEPERLGPHNMLFSFRHQTAVLRTETVRTLEELCVCEGGSPPAQETAGLGSWLLVMKRLLFAT